MFKRLSIVLLTSCFSLLSFSQNSEPDSVLSHSKHNLNDTVQLESNDIVSDSAEYELIQDTIRKIFNITEDVISDTLNNADLTDSLFLEENVLRDTKYKQTLSMWQDSMIFDEPDTTHYVIYNLNKLLAGDSLIISDSTKQAINKLTEFILNQEIEAVIDYLNYEIEDSSLFYINDSIYHAVRFLLNEIPEDSVKILFTNPGRDSVLLAVKENQTDSVLLKLYDNRGEFAVLWIKKKNKDAIDISLEHGFYIEKTRRHKLVEQRLEVNLENPDLRKVEQVNITIPIWKFEGLADIKFNQSRFESWAEGGENSMSAISVLKYSADYTYGKKRDLDTDVEYRLGYLKARENDLQKNDDKFEINIKYGKSAFNKWYYSGLLNFKTQFLNGYDYSNDTTIEISKFLSPAYLVFSLGLDFKPSDKLTVLFSPITSKFTIVADTVNFDQTRFGVGENEIIRKEIGAYIKAISKIKFRNNITLENKVNFFTNYTNNPQNIDIDWEMNLTIKLTEYINMSVNTHMIYDDDVDFPVFDNDGVQIGTTKYLQFKELFGIGFIYSF
ncbi:MAG: DUF3078 domain-containing protein [Bacteroidales bacterium]|nr:DUF3078 domain-containing protein [Bacteroidales bacterium]